MHRATIPADRLPRKAVSQFIESLQPLLEIIDYFQSEIYRLFFFVIDLVTLFLSV